VGLEEPLLLEGGQKPLEGGLSRAWLHAGFPQERYLHQGRFEVHRPPFPREEPA
jgi:hypothetical protein